MTGCFQTGPAARRRPRRGLPEPARHRLHPAESAVHQRLWIETTTWERGAGPIYSHAHHPIKTPPSLSSVSNIYSLPAGANPSSCLCHVTMVGPRVLTLLSVFVNVWRCMTQPGMLSGTLLHQVAVSGTGFWASCKKHKVICC